MKVKSLLIGFCLVSVSFIANAESCFTVPIDCGKGKGTNTIACGDTIQEIAKQANEVADVFCNQ